RIMNDVTAIVTVVRVNCHFSVVPRAGHDAVKYQRDDVLSPISVSHPKDAAVQGDVRLLGIGCRERLTQRPVVTFHAAERPGSATGACGAVVRRAFRLRGAFGKRNESSS